MTGFDGEDTHRQTRALYFLGALDPAADAEFEKHLTGCAECLDDSERLGPMLGGMAMLSGEEIGALVREHNADVARHGAAVGNHGAFVGDHGAFAGDYGAAVGDHGALAGSRNVVAGDRLDSRRRPHRPGAPPAAEARRGSRPPARPSGRRRSRLLIGVLAAVVLLAVAVVSGVNLLRADQATLHADQATIVPEN